MLLPVLDNNFHLSIIAGIEASLSGGGVGVAGQRQPQRGRGPPGGRRRRWPTGWSTASSRCPSAHDAVALTAGLRPRACPSCSIDRLVEGLDCDARRARQRRRGAAGRTPPRRPRAPRASRSLAGPPDIWSLRGRTDGFFDALRQHGLDVDPAMVRSGALTVESGRAAMRSLLAEPERPTAVVCLNYELTVGALIAVNESGLRMPEDLSFVGFDSLELSQVTKPRLSMVVQPTHEIAVRAADLMRERLEPQPRSRARAVPAGGAARRARARRFRRADRVPDPSPTRPPIRACPQEEPVLNYTLTHPRCWARWPPPATARRCCWPTGTTPPRPPSRRGAAVIHLNLRPGLLSVTDVLGPILEAVNVEAAPRDGAARRRATSPRTTSTGSCSGEQVAFSVVERFAFYEAARGPDVAFVVATGDQRICANLLLTIGVRT